jgi:hypothetical protein
LTSAKHRAGRFPALQPCRNALCRATLDQRLRVP